MRNNWLKSILVLLIAFYVVSCDEAPKSQVIDDYFGQPLPGDTAVVFAPGIVSTGQHEHSRITFSKDGTQMYWAVIPLNPQYESEGGSPFLGDEQNIWYSKWKNGEWSKPSVFEFTKNSGGSSPAFSYDGENFYYRTPKTDADPSVRPKPSQVWQVSYNDAGWGNPVHNNDLLPNENRKTFMSFCFTEKDNLYFDYGGPDSTGEWRWNIYLAEYSGGYYLAPVKIGGGINDGAVNWCPWVAPDESYIIFSSHREGGYGSGDLMISFKIDDEWSQPINMGPKINTPRQERFPSVSPDGKYFFFARHMPETFSDIFWVDAEIIEEFKTKK